MGRFWRRLDRTERDVVIRLAGAGQLDLDRDWPALASLINKTLVYQDIGRGTFHLFCVLFEEFVKLEGHVRTTAPRVVAPITFDEIAATLGRKERDLFDYLRRHANHPCTFAELIDAVWGSAEPNKRVLEAAMYRLRRALDSAGLSGWDYLRNVRAVGFEFRPAGDGGGRSAGQTDHARGRRRPGGPRASSAADGARPSRASGAR
jgi:hypothetical protein